MKKIYQKPCAIQYSITATNMLASSPTVNIVNDDDKTVETETDLWSNKREQGHPIWDNNL